MANNINRVMLSGNITNEPELRQSANGTAILKFGIAVNRGKKNQQGGWDEVASFFVCVIIGSRASGLSQYLHRGTKVYVDGELRQSTWTANDGSKRSKVEVYVNNLEFQNPKPKQQNGYQGDAQYVQAETYDTPQSGYFDTSDIPF
jgi:single-strand DNA-binding protein